MIVALSLSTAERSMRIHGALLALMDTTAQIRVRGAWLLLVAMVALASELGLELILGAFAAGAMLAIVDRDDAMTHPLLHLKLEAAGYGIFIPAFFVVSGMRFDLEALTSSASALAQVPVFLARAAASSAGCRRCRIAGSSATPARVRRACCRRRRCRSS